MTDPSRLSRATGILSVWNEYPDDDADFYERWYMTEHFPERLAVPGFLRGRRYRAIDADRTYFTFYDLDTPDVLFSPAYVTRLNDPTAWTARIMGRWTGMFRTACQRLARNGVAVGGFATVARFEIPADLSPGDAADLHRRLADPAVVAVDLWRATAEQNDRTSEAATRREADRTIAGAIVIETTSEMSAHRTRERLPALLDTSSPPATIGVYRLIALQDAP